MKKVKITVEQEGALKDWKLNDESFISFIQEVGTWHDYYEPLNDITPQEFSLMLAGWYELK